MGQLLGSDELDENNRNAPSVNRFFDGQYYSFDRFGQPVFGFLQTDRPHVFKIEGTYELSWGTGLGLYWLAESGTPLQTQMSEFSIPFYAFGRGDLGRTPAFYRTDLLVQHTFRMFGSHRVNLGLNIENLFDQEIVTRLFTTRYRDSFNVTNDAFFGGTFDPVAMANAAPTTYRPDPRFGLPDQWQNRREMRLELKYLF